MINYNIREKSHYLYSRDRPIYWWTDIIGQYLAFRISADIRISTDVFTDILVCLSTASAQFVQTIKLS